MRYFKVDDRVFEMLPDYCVGVVSVTGFDNSREYEKISDMLDTGIKGFAERHKDDNVREITGVKAYRDAFINVGMNPNKYMVSIEALAKRIMKNPELPHINPLVDLGNAFSVTYAVPMGAHDIDRMAGDFEIRFSTPEDSFLPMGSDQTEIMPEGELCYVSGNTVKTRRWMWRQSEDGKITEDTTNIFVPIDGFESVNRDAVIEARDTLAEFLKNDLGLDVICDLLDSKNRKCLIQN